MKVDNRIVGTDNSRVMIVDSGKAIVETRIILPEISREELLERYKKIRPIIKRRAFYYTLKELDERDLYALSLLSNLEEKRGEMVAPRDIYVVGEFPCYHRFNNMLEFSPKVAEVLSQFPDEYLKDSNLFYLSSYPQELEDFECQSEIIKAGCHKSFVKALRIEKK